MLRSIVSWPGKLGERFVESAVVGATATRQVATWFADVHRIRILRFAEREFPECYRQLDGGDKRLMRAFVDPDSLSNTYSILGGGRPAGGSGSLVSELADLLDLAHDAFGTEATFDNSFVEHQPGAQQGDQRWFFLNGIATSRRQAQYNVQQLNGLFKRPFTLIHNPTQGLTHDLVESALQKFTNINTEPVARAFLEIGGALVADDVNEVVVIAHSQGTIIMGDVLDLIYCSIDRKYFDRTNMDDEDFDSFLRSSIGTVKSYQLRELGQKLAKKREPALKKLQLFMFANAASRMCYVDEALKYPHIESFANEHDIVTRLGSLAREEFFREDLVRIDGALFTCDRYGHLLSGHYLSDLAAGSYRYRGQGPAGVRCVGDSVHDPVHGNPAVHHPKHVPGPAQSLLYDHYLKAQQRG